MTILIAIVCLWIGAVLGICIAAVCVMSSRCSR